MTRGHVPVFRSVRPSVRLLCWYADHSIQHVCPSVCLYARPPLIVDMCVIHKVTGFKIKHLLLQLYPLQKYLQFHSLPHPTHTPFLRKQELTLNSNTFLT